MIEALFNKAVRELKIISGFEMKQKSRIFEERGENVIHLEIGEPDFDTPRNIRDVAIDAINRGETHYAPALGIPPLRKAISDYATSYKGMNMENKEVVVTPGAKPILFYTFLAFVAPGDEVIIPNPGFPIYRALTKLNLGVPIPLVGKEENKFKITAEDLIPLVNSKTKLIILNSPNNPTGAVADKEELQKIAAFLADKDIILLSDEIYDRLYFGDVKPVSMGSFPEIADKTIILDGFSKTYAMTGWRLGYGIMPSAIASRFNPLIVASNSCTATFSQYAGIEALTGSQEKVNEMKDAFLKRRGLLVDGLNALPHITCSKPDGAFYVFPNFRHYSDNSDKLCMDLLEKAYISSLPGSTFGTGLDVYLRFSYATQESVLIDALNRLDMVLPKL